ncbi:PqiC family protein [Thiopseudomonas alkaliphila]|uniref:PqiC family protein n=1 Tax=Thiopseudomonas alkaliphila TaxID=1697053 RepID=UPI00069E84E4|nr:ABC-type transport auxiliary lipoprotein family protein [Thiopseudomonas alkaliphila]AKX53341.1 hypothetical protein AKN91_06410 [Thiopseudomonas alkaliphila]
MIKHLPVLPAVLAVLTMAGLGGCATTEPVQFYQLQSAVAAKNTKEHDLTVLLGPLKVADYLQRESILQRDADGSFSMAKGGRWAGSLQDNIGQYLVRQLAAELNTSKISLYPDRIGVEPQQQLVLSISRLDSGVQQPALIEAQWRLLDANGELLDSGLYTDNEPHQNSLDSQVKAQSALLQRLSKALSQQMRQQSAKRQVAYNQSSVRPAKTPAKTAVESASTTPTKRLATPATLPEAPVKPSAEQVEVFRF